MNDIISTVRYTVNDNWEKIVDLVSFFASILTIIVAILPILKIILKSVLIKPKNWKDRKAIRYSILNPIKESEYNEVAIIKLLIEFSKVIIPIIILLVTICMCSFWLNYSGFKDNMKGYLLILIEINACILCQLIKTKNLSKIYCILLEIANVVLLDFIILEYVVEYCLIHGVEIMVVLMTSICVCSFIIIELILVLNRNDNENRSRWFVLIEGFRIIWSSVYMVVLYCFATNESLIMYGNIASVVYIIIFMLLCCIEDKINNNIKVKFEIDMGQDVEVTQKTIYQYEYDKVKYTLANGCTKIIDSNEIKSINYMIKNTAWTNVWNSVKSVIGKSKMVNVTCLLENDDVLNFDGYNFMKDLWVIFYKLNENEKEIKIINSKRVKKIVIERSIIK